MFVFEDLILLLIGALIVTQIIVPAILGRRLFWLFRRKKPTLEDRIERAKYRRIQAEKEIEAAKAEAEAARLELEAQRIEEESLNEILDRKAK